MIKTNEIIQELINQVKKCVPESSNYLGEKPEGIAPPIFSYYIVFNESKQETYSTRRVILDLQIIYFGKANEKGIPLLEDKLVVMNRLEDFLNQFKLQVKNRCLKFKYFYDDVDDQLALNMKFKYTDGVIDLNRQEQEAREPVENIHLIHE